MKFEQSKMVIRFLESSEDIITAQALLYDIYITELGWKFSENNPSEIKIKALDTGKKILIDKHDSRAIWIGVFYNGSMIACRRFCSRDSDGKFEVQYYQKDNKKIDEILDKNAHPLLVELTRSAVSPDFRDLGIVFIMMLKLTFEYCNKHEISIFTTSGISSMDIIMQIVKCSKIPDVEFKYEQHDPNPVGFYFVDYNKGEVTRILKQIDQLLPKLWQQHFTQPFKSSFWKSPEGKKSDETSTAQFEKVSDSNPKSESLDSSLHYLISQAKQTLISRDTIRISFPTIELAKQFQSNLSNKIQGLDKQIEVIEIKLSDIDSDSNFNNNTEYGFTLTQDKYNALMGDMTFDVLLLEESQKAWSLTKKL